MVLGATRSLHWAKCLKFILKTLSSYLTENTGLSIINSLLMLFVRMMYVYCLQQAQL